MQGRILDRELLDAVEALGAEAFESTAWRVAWRTQDVLRGGPGGRWNPTHFPALYTSLEKHGAIAEVYSLLSKMPVFSSADKLIYRLQIKTRNTLVLDDPEKLASVGLDLFRDHHRNKKQCQLVGEAAYRLDYDSLLVPSVRWECLNLVLFPALLESTDIAVIEAHDINWPVWAEQNAEAVREYTRQIRKLSNI